MWKQISVFGLSVVAVAGLSGPSWSQEKPAGEQAKKSAFDDSKALAGWTVTGDVAVDKTRGRKGGALKVGPGGKALLRLRERDESGKVEIWVYDDGTKPEDVKARRVGPRWGLVQSDGKVLAAGILYASYLGGWEGYTATACDGRSWYEQLFWLGVKRAPAGWHKWTFDFDAEAGLAVFHDDKEVTAVDSRRVGLKGFNAIAFWGDSGKGKEQTVWLDDLSVTLGGPVTVAAVVEADPYDQQAIAASGGTSRPVIVYTQRDAPATPKLDGDFVKTIKEATGNDHDKDWARQGQAWDAFVNEMWAKHRPTLDAPTDGWKQKHDDRYYRTAIEKSQ